MAYPPPTDLVSAQKAPDGTRDPARTERFWTTLPVRQQLHDPRCWNFGKTPGPPLVWSARGYRGFRSRTLTSRGIFGERLRPG